MNIHDLNMLLEGSSRNCPHSRWSETPAWWITTAPVSLYWEAHVKHFLHKSSRVWSASIWNIKMLTVYAENVESIKIHLQPSVLLPGNWATSTFSRRLPEPQRWARLAILKFSHTPESARCECQDTVDFIRFWEAYLQTPSSNIVS